MAPGPLLTAPPMSQSIVQEERGEEPSEGSSEYRCPFCGSVYPDERLTRVHITWADDEIHRNYDGFMPETTVEVVDDDGNIVDEITRRTDELKTNDIDLDVFPDELSEAQRRVCRIVAYDPYIESYQELHERSEAVLSENDVDTVGYNTVRQWIQEFYLPHQDTTNPNGRSQDSVETALAELTEKQSAVITEYLEDPSLSMSELADRAGVSSSYPTQILDRFDDLIEELRETQADGSATATGDSDDELEGADDSKSNPTKDWECGTDATDEDNMGEEETTFYGQEDKPEESKSSPIDGPVGGPTAAIMSASPHDLVEDDSSTSLNAENEEVGEFENMNPSEVNEDSEEALGTESSQKSGNSPNQNVDQSSEASNPNGVAGGSEFQTVPREDIEQLIERLQFARRVAEREVESSDNTRAATQLALIAEIELELQTLLR